MIYLEDGIKNSDEVKGNGKKRTSIELHSCTLL